MVLEVGAFVTESLGAGTKSCSPRSTSGNGHMPSPKPGSFPDVPSTKPNKGTKEESESEKN